MPYNILERYEKALEQELACLFDDRDGLLYKMMAYQLGWIDEQGATSSGHKIDQFAPYLSLISCQGLGGEYAQAMPCAAALELVGHFSLIHEQVQIGQPNRDNRPTLWWVWGPGQAINAGDGMHALARLALMKLGNHGLPSGQVLAAMNLFDQSCLRMFEGQHLDLAFQERLDITIESYLEMVAAKSGALLSCAMGLGSLVATDDEQIVGKFIEAGRHIGIACQVKRDLMDIWRQGDQPPSENLLNKKKLFPIVYAMASAEIRVKRELGSIYYKRILENEDVGTIIAILDRLSAREYSEEQVAIHWQRSMEALNGIELSGAACKDLEAIGLVLTSHEG